MQELGDERLLAKDELMARWGQAITRDKADVGAALLADRPRLRVVTGGGSVAVDDIRAKLREAEEEVELQVVRVSMHWPEEVARAVRQAGDAPLVAVTRGGGQDVHDLDADEPVEAVASSPVPVPRPPSAPGCGAAWKRRAPAPAGSRKPRRTAALMLAGAADRGAAAGGPAG